MNAPSITVTRNMSGYLINPHDMAILEVIAEHYMSIIDEELAYDPYDSSSIYYQQRAIKALRALETAPIAMFANVDTPMAL